MWIDSDNSLEFSRDRRNLSVSESSHVNNGALIGFPAHSIPNYLRFGTLHRCEFRALWKCSMVTFAMFATVRVSWLGSTLMITQMCTPYVNKTNLRKAGWYLHSLHAKHKITDSFLIEYYRLDHSSGCLWEEHAIRKLLMILNQRSSNSIKKNQATWNMIPNNRKTA